MAYYSIIYGGDLQREGLRVADVAMEEREALAPDIINGSHVCVMYVSYIYIYIYIYICVCVSYTCHAPRGGATRKPPRRLASRECVETMPCVRVCAGVSPPPSSRDGRNVRERKHDARDDGLTHSRWQTKSSSRTMTRRGVYVCDVYDDTHDDE